MRKKIAEKARKNSERLVWRGTTTQRIEAFSDSVFAFALTLLIVSLEVPRTFGQLTDVLAGFFAFGISFVLLFQVWYYQNLFFRRYGMQDIKTIVLNAALLFTVLFYVYPLKFLFTFIAFNPKNIISITVDEIPYLMLVYGLGFCAIFTTFSLMYRNAAKNAETLGLSKMELFETRTHQYIFASYVGVGVFAIVCAFIVPKEWAGPTGVLYSLIGPVVGYISSKRGKKSREKFGE